MEKLKPIYLLMIIITCIAITFLLSSNIEWKHVPAKIFVYNNMAVEKFLQAMKYRKSTSNTTQPNQYSNKISRNKTIKKQFSLSFYTGFFNERPWEYFYPKKDYYKECGFDFTGCTFQYDLNNWTNSDVVFFHGRDMPSLNQLQNLKKQAKPGQLWTYFIMENPHNTPSIESLSSLFELSSSYRLKSDFFLPYGYYDELTSEESEHALKTFGNFSKGKTKQIAWMVSHCGTIRDKLALKFEELGLQIDVGGACGKNFKGKLVCQDRACKSTLKQYKFYFSAENNLCDNYITEKYWRNPFEIDAIPITLGGSNYSDPKLAIPGSFINALDFESPKELVNYIKKVDSNNTLYNQYFQWKFKYKLRIESRGCRKASEVFCKKLHAGIKPRKNPVISDINPGKECDRQERYFYEWIQK